MKKTYKLSVKLNSVRIGELELDSSGFYSSDDITKMVKDKQFNHEFKEDIDFDHMIKTTYVPRDCINYIVMEIKQ
jgi:dipeptidase